MINNPKNPRPFKVGEEVYNLLLDKIEKITEISIDDSYPIEVGNEETYTIDGLMHYEHEIKTIYHLDELPITITVELPRPKIKKDTKVRVWNNDRHKWNRYATGDFYDDGRILCFRGGADNFSSDDNKSSAWEYYEIVEDKK